jgi:hypothetical protein
MVTVTSNKFQAGSTTSLAYLNDFVLGETCLLLAPDTRTVFQSLDYILDTFSVTLTAGEGIYFKIDFSAYTPGWGPQISGVPPGGLFNHVLFLWPSSPARPDLYRMFVLHGETGLS